MPAYLKVVEYYSADYTFVSFRPNPMESPALK